MQRSCDACGVIYEAQTPRSMTCSPTCKKRRQRGARAPAKVTTLAPPAPVESAGLVAAVTRELTDGDRLDTALGQATMALARRVEDDRDTGSALASLVGRLEATLAAALKGVGAPTSKVAQRRDELAARRARGA